MDREFMSLGLQNVWLKIIRLGKHNMRIIPLNQFDRSDGIFRIHRADNRFIQFPHLIVRFDTVLELDFDDRELPFPRIEQNRVRLTVPNMVGAVSFAPKHEPRSDNRFDFRSNAFRQAAKDVSLGLGFISQAYFAIACLFRWSDKLRRASSKLNFHHFTRRSTRCSSYQDLNPLYSCRYRKVA